MGCVEARPFPLDELDVSPESGVSNSDIVGQIALPAELSNSGLSTEEQTQADAFNDIPSLTISLDELTTSATRRWVPMFQGDHPDCARNDNTCENGASNQNFNVTLGGFNNSFQYRNFFYDGPTAGGHNRNDYNESYIDDRRYIDPATFPGDNFLRYLPIVHEFRANYNGNTNAGYSDYLASIGANARDHEYKSRSGYVGWWNDATETYNGKYDLPLSIDESISDNDGSTSGPNSNCPAAILPLTDTRSEISDHVAGLYPAGFTNVANGAMWGWRTLSSGAPFTEGIAESDPDFGKWQKAVVIMTDGLNVVGSRDTHYNTRPSVYGYGSEERMGANINTAGEMENEIDNKLLRICHRMKQEGYLVYTVMFGLSTSEGNQVRPLYQACATEPSDPYFFDIDNGAQLEEAFEDIAADLVKLHVSR